MLASFSGTASYFFSLFHKGKEKGTVLGGDLCGGRMRGRGEREGEERDETPLGCSLEYAKVSRTLTMKSNTAKHTQKDRPNRQTLTHTHTQVATHCPILALP